MKLVELAFLSSWEPGLHAIVLSESLLRVNASCCAWLWSLFFCEYSWVHSLAAFLAGLFSTYTPCCLEWWHVAFPTLQHVPTGFKFCMVTVLVLSRECSCNLGPGIKALHVDSYRRCDNIGYLPKCGPEEQAQISAWEAAVSQDLAGVEPGIGLHDPCGSLPIWDIQWFSEWLLTDNYRHVIRFFCLLDFRSPSWRRDFSKSVVAQRSPNIAPSPHTCRHTIGCSSWRQKS